MKYSQEYAPELIHCRVLKDLGDQPGDFKAGQGITVRKEDVDELVAEGLVEVIIDSFEEEMK